jgi:hypothetical protein
MRYFLLSVLLLITSWAAAQNSQSQTDPSQTSPNQTSSQTTPTSAGSQTTVQGCLSGSDGSYTVTDKSGASFQLTGDTSKLSQHVGHEIKVTGTVTSASTPSSDGSASSAASASDSSKPTLEVSSFKHVAKTCTSDGASH